MGELNNKSNSNARVDNARSSENTYSQNATSSTYSDNAYGGNAPIMRKKIGDGDTVPAKEKPKANNTGLPDQLKLGIEQLSGYSMDDVKVHYNSPKPAQLQAHAYAQGTDIHVAPGQQKHLAHEAWHVVQQMQGRVQPTTEINGISIDDSLEKEADVMGAKAMSVSADHKPSDADKKEVKKKGAETKQLARKSKAELLQLTVDDFDAHRKKEQMDWANAAGFTKNERDKIWSILSWGTGGLSTFKLADIFTKITADASNFTHLKNYCEAITGKINKQPAIQLEPVVDIDVAIKHGEWVVKIISTIGASHSKSTIPLDKFQMLVLDTTYAQSFLDYYTNQKPILQTPTGKEISCYLMLVRDEGATISDYTTDLPDIRNYHKFEKDSLDKLKTDKGKKDKPLTLVLVSTFDHNGAFIRHAHVNKVIQNVNTNAYAIEGADIAKLTNLKDTGIAQIAADHGQDGKITQMMIAGHGSSKLMEVGGKDTQSGTSTQTGNEITIPDYSTNYYLEFDTAKTALWTAFFNKVFDNMAKKGGLDPKILLRACLTGSNSIDSNALTTTLKSKEGLDLLDGTVDQTTDENQGKIRAAIKEQFETNGSLVSVLENQAKGKGVEILGAQASITSYSTQSVDPATGELGIIPATGIPVKDQDPYVAGSKINYVRHGKEPTGAIKAVIESWAIDKDDCFLKMDDRVKNPVATNDGAIIGLLYDIILKNYKKDILTANKFVNTAGMLHGIGKGGHECKPDQLRSDAMTQAHQSTIYTELLTKFASKTAKLVIYQDWMDKDNSKRKNFIDTLADASFDKNNSKEFINFTLVSPHLSAIFTGNIGTERGRIILALLGVTKSAVDADCKTYLLTQKDAHDKLLKVVTDELKGYSEDRLREKLGLPVEAAPNVPVIGGGLGAVSKPGKNIDTPKDFYVFPMRETVFEKASAFKKIRVRETPESTSTERYSYNSNRDIIVVGEVRNINDDSPLGRWMVKCEDNSVGYVSSTSIKKK